MLTQCNSTLKLCVYTENKKMSKMEYYFQEVIFCKKGKIYIVRRVR